VTQTETTEQTILKLRRSIEMKNWT